MCDSEVIENSRTDNFIANGTKVLLGDWDVEGLKECAHSLVVLKVERMASLCFAKRIGAVEPGDFRCYRSQLTVVARYIADLYERAIQAFNCLLRLAGKYQRGSLVVQMDASHDDQIRFEVFLILRKKSK